MNRLGNRNRLETLLVLVSLVFTNFFNAGLMNAVQSQTRADNWYFGDHTGIHFVGDTVLPLLDSDALIDEGVVSMSEENGDLYFYSGTWKVGSVLRTSIWNKNHEVMSNGEDLLFNTSASQGIAAVLNPSNPREHYIFTLDRPFGGQVTTLYYSILDHDLDNGLGDIKNNQKNVFVKEGLAEKLIVAKKSDSSGYWVITHQNPGTEIYVFSLDSNGLDTVPQVFNGTLAASFTTGGAGFSKLSSDVTKLAMCQRVQTGNVEIFDFDISDGTVSNPIVIKVPANIGWSWPYGIEFSPNSQLLYVIDNSIFPDFGSLFQWDISSHDSTIIANTIVTIHDSVVFTGGLQLGPDLMIYATGHEGLHRIESPDVSGLGCNLNVDFMDLNTATGWVLPYFPTFQLVVNDTTDTTTTDTTIVDTTDSTISVQEIYNSQPYVPYLDVFPNPTGSVTWINMKVEGLVRIDLRDLAGRKIRTVYEGPSSNGDVIESDLSDLAPGVYVYTLSTKSGHSNHKVVRR
jgi:hypothetical protein